MSGAKLKLSDDRTTIQVEVPENIGLNAVELEDLIEKLIEARCQLLPERPARDPFPGTRVITHANMRWFISPAPERPCTELLLLHPGFGWVGIALDRSGSVEMIGSLARNMPNLPPEPSPED